MSSSISAVLHTERLVGLRAFPGFSELEPETVSSIAENVRERFFPAGTTIFYEGERIDHVLFIISGQFSLRRHGHDVSAMFQHQSVGFIQALGLIPALANNLAGIEAVARTDVYAYEIELNLLWEVLEEHFEIMAAVLGGLARQLIFARRKLLGTAGFASEDPADPPPAHRLDLVERVLHLRKVMVVAGSRIEALIGLARESIELRLNEDTLIWQEGDSMGSMLMLIGGEIECSTKAGHRFLFAAGDTVGGLDTLAQMPRWFTARTVSPVVALRIETDSFFDAVEDNPDIGRRLIEDIAQGVDDLYEKLAGHAPNGRHDHLANESARNMALVTGDRDSANLGDDDGR
ncbi:MAG: cyclic nucleotide-binding domain-containing protein [Myxococcota bacterium]